MFHVVIVSSKTYLHKYMAQLVLLALPIVRVDCLRSCIGKQCLLSEKFVSNCDYDLHELRCVSFKLASPRDLPAIRYLNSQRLNIVSA